MKEVVGKYDKAIIYTDNVEEQALNQIKEILDSPISENAHTRIMPDVHAGAGSVIGYTARLGEKVNPFTIGVDIGCGVLAVPLSNYISRKVFETNVKHFDDFIRNEVPNGKGGVFSYLPRRLPARVGTAMEETLSRTQQDFETVFKSLGTLGGGNHFIEVGVSEDFPDDLWLLVHSGSRNFGYRIATYHQDLAYEKLKKSGNLEAIGELKRNYYGVELGEKIKELKKSNKAPSKELSYLFDQDDVSDYLHDLYVAQRYANENRFRIAETALRFFRQKLVERGTIDSVHNYIDPVDKIIRKGAIGARQGDPVVIPLNMRDGAILGVGKGNPEWNCSAPHGSGRVLSRKAAKESLSFEDFKKSMDGVYTTSVSLATLDEAPEAYKPSDEIIGLLQNTVYVTRRLLPIWNFKARDGQ